MSLSALESPHITAMQQVGSNVVVDVAAPAGARLVRLESRTRLGAGSWTPRAIARPDGKGGTLRFTLPNRTAIELLRVTAAEQDDLPEGFYQGTNEFAGSVSSAAASGLYPGINYGTTEDTTAGPGSNPGTGSGAVRTVAESDIWRVAGNRVYFFNLLRGLQVIDIESPDHPVLRGTLNLPAAGEQMYLLDNEVVVLLIQANCYFGLQQSQVLVVSAKEPQPRIISRLSVDGYITESRMVGTALYVATQTYQTEQRQGQTVYTAGTELNSFDLSDPAAAKPVGKLWYPGYNSVVAATDRLFFVVNQSEGNWTRSLIHTVDITAPTGEMAAYVDIQAAGVIRDKFKLDYQGTRFTCISEETSDTRRTRLETFFLADPRAAGPISLRKLGEVKLAERESLFGTRFDGDKAYIVTFQRIDPLFIVDLSDATRPRIVSELLVPGFSTYIQPLGDRLVTIGTETNRVAVSLFDVRDPAKPNLLSRVLLGNSYSWSESVWNEKAVSILPEDHLILVPYSGDTTNGYAARVQLIELEENQLKARGMIERTMEARRATLHRDRIYAVSARELLVVEASDRDHPQVKEALDLSWSVDRVLVKGNFLLELSSQARWWGAQTLSQLRVARMTEPDRAVATLTLSNLPIVGAVLRGGVLHLAQSAVAQGRWYPLMLAETGAAGADNPDPGPMALFTTIDVGDPSSPRILGQQTAKLPSFAGGTWQALWPKAGEDLLVWFVSGGFSGYPGPIGIFPGGAAVDAMIWPGWWYSTKPTTVALDVRNPAAIQVDSVVELGKDTWSGVSAAVEAEGLIFFSHSESEIIEDALNPDKTTTGGARDAISPSGAFLGDIPYRYALWRQKHRLDVVDFADSRNPTVRDSASLPGALKGISAKGQLLYTLDQELDATGAPTGKYGVSALAYDGVSAHRVDVIPSVNQWMPIVQVTGENLWFSRPVANADQMVTGSLLETWRLSGAGKWEKRGSFAFPTQLQLLVQRGDLLVAFAQTTSLLDASDPAALKEVGRNEFPSCGYGDINQGDGTLDQGFWIPMGDYGLSFVPRSR